MFKTMNSADILLSNGMILTLDYKNSQFKNGSVATSSDVKTTIINGEVAMGDGHLLSLDLKKTMGDIRKIAEDIRNC